MTPVRMNANDALIKVELYEKFSSPILGVEGFELKGSGYIARLDLIIDLSEDPLSASNSYVIAKEFIKRNASDNIVFEIVT